MPRNAQEFTNTPYEYTKALFDSMVEVGDLPTQRGWNFERAFPSFVRLCPDYKTDMVDVQRFEEWASAAGSGWTGPTNDLGIDFVITLKSEKPVAVQTKYRTGKADVDSIRGLVSQTRTQNRADLFSDIILVTNSSDSNHTRALRQEADRLNVKILGEEWFVDIVNALMSAGIAPPRTVEELLQLTQAQADSHTPLLKPFSLRPHQELLHAGVKAALKDADATTVHAACGTGKTLTAWALMRDEELVPAGGLVTIFTPALSLADGTARAFKRQQTDRERYDIKAVCSDDTVNVDDTALATQRAEKDINPAQLHAPVLHGVEEIRAWLTSERAPGDHRRRVLISTYQSSELVKEAMSTTGDTADLMILDEAHRLTGLTFGKPVWDMSVSNRVSLTATPRITTLSRRKKSTDDDNVTITSMDDETKFGKKADWATYPISMAIDDKVLSPYVIEIILTPHSDAINSEVRVDDADTNARTMAIAKICKDIHDNESGGKGSTIVFFNRVADSKKFAKLMKAKYGNNFPAHHVDGSTPVDKRLQAISDIRKNGGVLSNVRVLNEGVDIPSLNAVVFASNIDSKVDIIQSMGRALRIDPLNPNKVARIIVPTAFTNDNYGDGTELDTKMSGSDFSPVWEVIKAVCDHDDTMMESMIGMRRQLGRGETPTMPAALRDKIRISNSGVEYVDVVDAQEMWDDAKLEAMLDSITTGAVRKAVSSWYGNYGATLQYSASAGKFPSNMSKDLEERRLGAWCASQRVAYRKGTLSEERIQMLTAIPSWNWGTAGAMRRTWEENREAVIKHASYTGGLPVGQSKDQDGYRPGKWCARQRADYNKGTLSAERIALLEEVPGWEWSNTRISAWTEKYNATLQYVARTGNIPSHVSNDQGDRRLGLWCFMQRVAYREGKLPAERIALLEDVAGWEWSRAMGPR